MSPWGPDCVSEQTCTQRQNAIAPNISRFFMADHRQFDSMDTERTWQEGVEGELCKDELISLDQC